MQFYYRVRNLKKVNWFCLFLRSVPLCNEVCKIKRGKKKRQAFRVYELGVILTWNLAVSYSSSWHPLSIIIDELLRAYSKMSCFTHRVVDLSSKLQRTDAPSQPLRGFYSKTVKLSGKRDRCRFSMIRLKPKWRLIWARPVLASFLHMKSTF